jgi:hypothetical protein
MFTVIFVFASIAFSQTIIIQPKKTVYARKGKDISKEKRTFTVIYPLFNGTMSPAAKKKLENTISYWRVFDTTLAENMSEDWLSNLYYKVNYNKNGILDISLIQEGSAAYPDSQTYNYVVDLKTGERVKFADVFKSESLADFAKMVDKKLKAETAGIIKRVDKGEFGDNGKEADDSVKEQLNALEFTPENFDEFSISDKGVTILYDAGFPHVIQAAQPDGRFLFTWAELKPFLKADGLLGKFIR